MPTSASCAKGVEGREGGVAGPCGDGHADAGPPTEPPKRPITRSAVTTASETICLPSPDLNPIEGVFAKLQAHPRKANARSFQRVQAAIARFPTAIIPQECRTFFAMRDMRQPKVIAL